MALGLVAAGVTKWGDSSQDFCHLFYCRYNKPGSTRLFLYLSIPICHFLAQGTLLLSFAFL